MRFRCYPEIVKQMTIRLPEGLYDALRTAADTMRVTVNDLVEEAVTARLDDRTVTFAARNANQAARLRRLAREHGSLGLSFPNNDPVMGSWSVRQQTDGGWEAVNPHEIPSVGVELKSVFGAKMDCCYPLGHLTGRRGLCARCGG
jgi:hypothetical protein